MSSWKTTATAIIGLVILILNVANTGISGGLGAIDWGTFVPALVTAIGLLFARDNDKSSEDVGAK